MRRFPSARSRSSHGSELRASDADRRDVLRRDARPGADRHLGEVDALLALQRAGEEGGEGLVAEGGKAARRARGVPAAPRKAAQPLATVLRRRCHLLAAKARLLIAYSAAIADCQQFSERRYMRLRANAESGDNLVLGALLE